MVIFFITISRRITPFLFLFFIFRKATSEYRKADKNNLNKKKREKHEFVSSLKIRKWVRTDNRHAINANIEGKLHHVKRSGFYGYFIYRYANRFRYSHFDTVFFFILHVERPPFADDSEFSDWPSSWKISALPSNFHLLAYFCLAFLSLGLSLVIFLFSLGLLVFVIFYFF